MLKKIISRTVVIVKDQSNLMRLNCKPIYNFSGLQISSKLNKAISAEIAHQQANIEDISSYQNYFKNSGWNINYNDVQIQLSTQNKGYDIRALFNCKTPVSQPEMQQNQQQADQMMSGFDFSQISLYVRKQGQNKWFNCEFIVPTNGQAHINVMRFTQDYEWEKSQRAKRRQIPSAYNGPDVTSLEEKFQDAVYQFISGIGVSVDILQKVAEFSLSYEHKFYIQWLKDFKALS